MNKVFLSGRLTADPELRKTPQDISTCSFSLAVRKEMKVKEGEPNADFINCTLDVGRGGAFYTDIAVGNLTFTGCTFDACKTGNKGNDTAHYCQQKH